MRAYLSRSLQVLLLLTLVGASTRYAGPPIPSEESRSHAGSLLDSDGATACELTCAHLALDSKVPVYFAPDQLADTYAGQQGEIMSACRVEPGDADEVAYILAALRAAKCKFALRSGGHSAWPGASNSDGGITLSLRRIKHVELSEDRKTVRLGSGAQWLEVYSALDEHELAVVGGRAGTVGVGGLLLGGGISYISRRYGLGLDTVVAFEIVLPNGTIARIDKSQAELYRVMKGSGLSNFGIVTSFEVEAVRAPQAGYRLSFSTSAWDETPAIVDALHAHLTDITWDDPDAMLVPIFTYNQELGLPLAIVLQIHSNHSDLASTPAVFRPFEELPTLAPAQPALYTYAETLQLGIDLGPPNGKRADYAVTAFRPSVAAFNDILAIIAAFFDQIKHIKGLYVNALPSFMYRDIIRQMARNGGNSLCVEPDEAPFWVFSLAANWDDPADDDFMSGLLKDTVRSVEQVAEKHGVSHPYRYFNYAAHWQAEDVWAGYGKEALERMRQLQREYDPEQVFVAGGLNGLGFKLNSKEEKPVPRKDEL